MSILFMLAALGTARADWYHNTLAFEINADNIESVLGQEQHVILDFFTPWCIYCQYMANDWNRVWEHYSGPNGSRRKDVLIAKMNCGDEPNHKICHQYHVHSFPTILHMEPKSAATKHVFTGNRAYADFVQWIDDICPETEKATKGPEDVPAATVESKSEELPEVPIHHPPPKRNVDPPPQNVPKHPNVDLEKQEPTNGTTTFAALQDRVVALETQFTENRDLIRGIDAQNSTLTEFEKQLHLVTYRLQKETFTWAQGMALFLSGILLGLLVSLCVVKLTRRKFVEEEKSV